MSIEDPVSKEIKENDTDWRRLYVFGAVMAFITLIGIILDMVIGSTLGSDLSVLPHSAMERFAQFAVHPWIGLYTLDILNATTQLLTIPVYVALYGALRKTNAAVAGLAFVIFLIGTAIFVANNVALPMLSLSREYAASDQARQGLLVAAGEAMLARGAHGSPGAFFGFLLPTLAGIIMSGAMVGGRVFSRLTGIFGLAGNAALMSYIVLVTFVPGTEKIAMILAAPGGILMIVWVVMYALRLLRLGSLGPCPLLRNAPRAD
ncbi:MAG: DUF4386 family protein [Spirochaetia bacterium]|jgi:hypothetical protein|nr:DUF4386 family protein [Spirochaetia bacterium]